MKFNIQKTFIYLSSARSFSLLSFLIGVIMFLSLSLFELNQKTYVSENALLVGLIKQQFINRSAIDYFYNEILALSRNGDSEKTKQWLMKTMENIQLDVGVQNFTFKYEKYLNLQQLDGQNVYGILRSPGAARMQAILVTAPLRYGDSNDEIENQPLLASISMMLALAQHARNKLYWATDIIFLFTEMEYVGFKAWLNAYHGLSDSNGYIEHQPLVVRSGSILAGFNVELTSVKIPYVEFRVESLNGQLPNLDLYNTFVRLAHFMEIPIRIHGVPRPISSSLKSRQNGLKSFLSMMWYQASGSPNGLHGLLPDFQIPSLTIYSPPNSQASSKTNLFAITKLMESTLRSLNGLQERMHQSFFFYILPSPMNYVSIGMYMIPFGVMCGCGLVLQVIGAIYYFHMKLEEADKSSNKKQEDILDWRNLGLVVVLSIGVGFLTDWGLDQLMANSRKFNIEPSDGLLFGSFSICLGVMLFCRLKVEKTNQCSIVLLRGALQLGLGLFLSTLSVLNISMAFFFALLVVPCALFIHPYRNRISRFFCKLYLIVICPLFLLYLAALVHNNSFSLGKNKWDSIDLYKSSILSTRNWILQGWIERDVLGSWTVNIFILCYFPIWVMMWCISCLPSPTQ